jgi:DNA-binding Xre family transcriptional regulator
MELNTDRIKLELDRIEQNQSWLARQLGITRAAVSVMMVKRRGRSFSTIEKLAKVLRVDEQDLVIF